MAIDVETLPSLNYTEAMAVVDAGGTVSRKSEWTMTAAGFAWGVWVCRQQRYTDEDMERMHRGEMNVAASGRSYRAFHTLCESVECSEPAHDEWLEATDWFDATEAMAEMWLLHSLYFDSGQPLGQDLDAGG